MATKKTIELEVNTNAKSVQDQFSNLRKSIAETKEAIDKLDKSSKNFEKDSKALNSQLEQLESSYKSLSKENTDLYEGFKDWNPERILSNMKQQSVRTEYLDGKENLKGLKIEINSEVIKKQLKQQSKKGWKLPVPTS